MLWVGKAGTFGLMFAYPAFLLAHGHAGWQTPITVIAWCANVSCPLEDARVGVFRGYTVP